MVLICLEGNISTGKSSCIAALRLLRPSIVVQPENVNKWGDLLQKFYENPKKWALQLSIKILLDFKRQQDELTALEAHHGGNICVFRERSPAACRYVFTQILMNEGTLDAEQFEIFKNVYDRLSFKDPDAIVFLDCPQDLCLDRVARRGRKGEEHITLDYLQKISFQYETMLRYSQVPCIRVFCNNDDRDAKNVATEVLMAIDNLLDV